MTDPRDPSDLSTVRKSDVPEIPVSSISDSGRVGPYRLLEVLGRLQEATNGNERPLGADVDEAAGRRDVRVDHGLVELLTFLNFLRCDTVKSSQYWCNPKCRFFSIPITKPRHT